MPTIPDAEYTNWKTTRDTALSQRGRAIIGGSNLAPEGSPTAHVSAEYANQQSGPDSSELKINSGYSIVDYDMYKGKTGIQGYPETSATEQAILAAAVHSAYTYTETIPAQVQLSLMQAARKAHNNWRQRRQQLLAHRQMLAANFAAANADLAKLVAGKNLDGVVDVNGSTL